MSKKTAPWAGYAAVWKASEGFDHAVVVPAGAHGSVSFDQIAEAYARRSSLNCDEPLYVLLTELWPTSLNIEPEGSIRVVGRAFGKERPVKVHGLWKVSITVQSEQVG